MCGIMCVGVRCEVNIYSWLPALPGIRTSPFCVSASDAAKVRARATPPPIVVMPRASRRRSRRALVCDPVQPCFMGHSSRFGLRNSRLQVGSAEEGNYHVPSRRPRLDIALASRCEDAKAWALVIATENRGIALIVRQPIVRDKSVAKAFHLASCTAHT